MRRKTNINIQNRKARHDYEITDTYIAGVVLTGTEIKSIREGKASLVDSHCYVDGTEVWMKESYIARYESGSYNNHDERRLRKLLLTKKEIRNLNKGVAVKGMTIIPLKMFINDKGLCKVELALARGKKEYDKRQTIKERELKREMQR